MRRVAQQGARLHFRSVGAPIGLTAYKPSPSSVDMHFLDSPLERGFSSHAIHE